MRYGSLLIQVKKIHGVEIQVSDYVTKMWVNGMYIDKQIEEHATFSLDISHVINPI